MQEICNKYRVKQVSERSYPANFIYQALPLVCDIVCETTGHIVVVVLPPVNLMKDQTRKLANIGITDVTP